MHNDNRILMFEEAMEMLHIRKNTLYQLLRSGELNAFKIGNVWKITEGAVLDYIDRKMKEGG